MNWIERLAVTEVRRLNPALSQRIPYAGDCVSRDEAQRRCQQDNHMALRAAARGLLESHRSDTDPRWRELERLLRS